MIMSPFGSRRRLVPVSSDGQWRRWQFIRCIDIKQCLADSSTKDYRFGESCRPRCGRPCDIPFTVARFPPGRGGVPAVGTRSVVTVAHTDRFPTSVDKLYSTSNGNTQDAADHMLKSGTNCLAKYTVSRDNVILTAVRRICVCVCTL